MIVDIKNQNSLQDATKVLNSGGVLIMPTDTVYGVGCLMIEEAILKLYQIKNRPANQPTAILMSRNIFDSKRMSELVLPLDIDTEFMAGKVTIIDSIDNYAIKFPEIITQNKTIGIRLPQYPWLEKLIDEVGPIVATSANKKGDETPTKFSEISDQIIKEVNLTIKTDEVLGDKSSAIYKIQTQEFLR